MATNGLSIYMCVCVCVCARVRALVCVCVCVCEISYITFHRQKHIYIFKNGCMSVCMFQHNSGTPGAISTKLGTHMATYI
jgi:hypothetical protein